MGHDTSTAEPVVFTFCLGTGTIIINLFPHRANQLFTIYHNFSFSKAKLDYFAETSNNQSSKT
jgi:hypothetical protein